MSALPWIAERIRAQAVHAPNAVALVDDGRMTYSELWQDAAARAKKLSRAGVGTGSLVAVALGRGADQICTCLAIWLLNAAWCPVDPALPSARRNAIVDQAKPHVLVAEDGEYTELDARELLPAEAAYVVFTSGSTGIPKGVLVGHDSLKNFVCWNAAEYSLGPGDTVLHLSAVGFDAALWDIWPALVSGSVVHVCPEEARTDPVELADVLARSRTTVAFVTTALATPMIASGVYLPHLKALQTGGDALTLPVDHPFSVPVVNHYGPTEATIVTTFHPITHGHAGDRPPIGTPITGSKVLVVDNELTPLPPGTAGELLIGGRSPALGYLDDPDSTETKFVRVAQHRGRWYRSGDRAIVDAGVIQFAGRVNADQLSVRGMRVESGDIVNALLHLPYIRGAAATVVGAGMDAVLVALIDSPAAQEIPRARIRADLSALLPLPLVPNRFVRVGFIPVTHNGKVDHTAVSRIALEATGIHGTRAEPFVVDLDLDF